MKVQHVALACFLAAALILAPQGAWSENAPAPVPAATVVGQPLFKQSLFFSPMEMLSIQRVLQNTPGGALPNGQQAIPTRRTISLSGVIFRKPDDWIVWLNGKKMTPGDVLPEVVDIKVEDNIVHLKWFDIGLNDIISISLKPHQTYDITTGILLPG